MANLEFVQRLRTLETLSAIVLALNPQKAQDFIQSFEEPKQIEPKELAALLRGKK